MKKFILISLIIFNSIGMIAQETGPHVYVSPRINIGYTFGAGINYGFDVVLGLYSTKNFNFGLAYSHYFVNVPKDFHRIKSINLVIENDMVNARIGVGVVKRKWGLRGINKATAPGISVDISVGFDQYRAPWVGVKSFIVNRKRWTFFDLPSYISIYGYFKTEEIEVYDQREP